MSGRQLPRPPGQDGDEINPPRPASSGGARPARPRSAIRMLNPQPGAQASATDLASQLGLDAGQRSSISGTRDKMSRARARMVRAPGSAAGSDSDSDSSSDDGGAAPVRSTAQRPARRRLLPATPSGGGLTGGSQFRMMRVPTAVKKEEAPPRTPTGGPGARPRMAVQQRGETPTGRADSRMSSSGSEASLGSRGGGEPNDALAFTAVPIAPASHGKLSGSKGLATPHELADYTKRKVSEIMQRERQTLARETRDGRTSRMSDASSVGSLDIDKIRAVRGKGSQKDESESSDEEDEEEDADQLFMMELKKEDLSRNTKFILCLGFTGLIVGFLAIFVLLIQASVNHECDKPWFHDTQHFSYSAAPRCGWMKRCGNIGGVTCSSEPIECWLEEITVTHFRGAVVMQLLPPPNEGETQPNLTATVTHFGATRRGISGIVSTVESEDKKLDIFSADTTVMTLDSNVDKYINCRKSDITVNLPGDLGTNQCGEEDPDCGRRVARTLDEFPSIKVSTTYGSIVLPRSDDFYFKKIDLTTVESDLEYDAIRASHLAFESTAGALRITGPSANYVGMTTAAGAIYASAVNLMNITEQDPLTGEHLVLGFGTFNATSDTGNMEVGITTRGIVEIRTGSGSVDLTVANSFAGQYELVCPGCGLAISGSEGTIINEALREKGRLTGSIGTFQGGASIFVTSNTGDVTVRVVRPACLSCPAGPLACVGVCARRALCSVRYSVVVAVSLGSQTADTDTPEATMASFPPFAG